MPYKNPCGRYTHLAFTYSVGPSSVARNELGPAPPFSPMRVLEVPWSRALSLACEEAALTYHTGLSKPFFSPGGSVKRVSLVWWLFGIGFNSGIGVPVYMAWGGRFWSMCWETGVSVRYQCPGSFWA
jgi:hypothetical protein